MVPFYYYHFDLIIKVKYFQKNTVRNGYPVFVYIPLHILTYIYNSIRQRKLHCFRFEIK
jgi:hypothetical protein